MTNTELRLITTARSLTAAAKACKESPTPENFKAFDLFLGLLDTDIHDIDADLEEKVG